MKNIRYLPKKKKKRKMEFLLIPSKLTQYVVAIIFRVSRLPMFRGLQEGWYDWYMQNIFEQV